MNEPTPTQRTRGRATPLHAASALVALALAALPTTARAQSHVDWYTPSLAVAALARTRGDTRFDAAFDLRLDALFGDPLGVRAGAFVDGRVTTSAEISAAAGASLATSLSRHDGGSTLVLSIGGAVHDRDGLTPAALGRVWWGLRTPIEAANRYEIAVGVWAEARYFPRDGTVDALLGVSVDPYALTLPFRYFFGALSSRP